TGIEKQDAIARQTIAAGPTSFLVIALKILRQIVVHDEAHIWFVDSHPKGNRRADHANVVAQKCFLMTRAISRVEPGVIWLRRNSVCPQLGGDRLGSLSARAINNSAVVRPIAQKSK